MTNYTFIADNDPGGDLTAAFATMSAETVASNPEKRMTYRSIANEVGFAESAELEAGVLDPNNGMPVWLNADLQSRGIDVNNTTVAALIGSLVSEKTANAIIATGVLTSPKYSGLTLQTLEKARVRRASGDV